MDNRFSHVVTDPRFRTLRKSDKKVKVDKRFQKMFSEKKFKLKSCVDKRGKQTNEDNSEDYKKFYNISDSEEEEEEEEKEKEVLTKALKRPNIPNARGLDSEEEDQAFSSSSESEDSSDENEELEHKWNEWDKDVPKTDSATKRLAVCNLDWDRINANDLFVLINSFKPSNGSILSVKIFPSELGLQRMRAEAESGPIQFIKTNKIYHKSNDNQNEGEEQEADDPKLTEELRQYEMTRLQYFYAVVECDSAITAEVLYNELDGMEYESSSTALDLRFIPEEMAFDGEVEPKSECHSMPDLSSYKAPQFINTALQQSKVTMTWDQTDPKRKDVFERAFNKECDDDLKAYLATSDEEDEEEEQLIENVDSNDGIELKTKDKINKYKDLLNSLNEPKDVNKEDNLEMEISWEPNLKDMAEDMVGRKERQKDVSNFEQNFMKMKEKRKEKKNKLDSKSDDSDIDSDSEQTIDRKQRNRDKSKKKRQKTKPTEDPNLELLFMDSSDNTDKKHFNYKNIIENQLNPKKRKDKTNDSFKVSDQYFDIISHFFSELTIDIYL